MLSTTTNSRQEYLREKTARREKTMSEPGLTRNYSEPIGLCTEGGGGNANNGNVAMSPTTAPTPSNSPSRPGLMGPSYQIVCINPQFVTSLTSTSLPTANRLSPTTGIPSVCQPNSLTSAAAAVVATTTCREPEEVQLRVIEFGAKYSQDSLEHEAFASRTRRTKIARLKRFKRPYEVPWRQQVEHSFLQSPISVCGIGTPTEQSLSRSAERPCTSNTSIPGMNGARQSQPSELGTVTRSKSLDEIDFNKLRLAESVNRNYSSSTTQQGLEVDNMAQHLQNLQVNE